MAWMTTLTVVAWALGTTTGWSRALAAGLLGLALLALVTARRGRVVVPAVLAAALGAGALRGATAPWWSGAPRPGALRLDGRVVRGCDARGDFVRCEVVTATLGRVSLRAPRGRCDAAPGDLVTAVATARPIVPWRNPPLEDPSMQSLRRGVAWRLETARCVVLGRDATAVDELRRAARSARRSVDGALRATLSADGAARAAALLFGDERGLDDATVEAFRETGLAHLLAVSGAHVAVVLRGLGAAVLWLANRACWLAARGLGWRLARVVPLPLAGFFVLMTGESPASVRALVSGVAVALLSLAGRRPRPLDVLALTVLAMTLAEPALLHDLGLQLSAVATAALVARGDDDERAPPAEGRWRRARVAALAALGATVRVGLAVTPLLALRFGRAPALATLVNLVAAPLAEVVALPLALATALASMASPALAAPVAWLTERALALLFALAAEASRVPWASAPWPPPTAGQASVATLALVALGAVGWRARGVIALVALAAVATMEQRLRAARSTHGALRVTALDVGQGDALVVDLPDGSSMLVDAGGALHGEADPGATVVVPWLRATRRTTLAVVALSHPHPDHGGGLAAVFEAVTVRSFWDTGQGAARSLGGFYAAALSAAARRGVARRDMASLCGERTLGGARVTVLAPCPLRPEVEPNDASLVLRLDLGRASALLPGDLEAAGERGLLAAMRPVSVLKVGHHGSRTSTTPAFLDALRPSVALISCGHPSPFGHPHPSVVDRLARRGVSMRRTDRSGLVTATLHPDGRVD